MKLKYRKTAWALLAALGALGLWRLLQPSPVEVDLAAAARGPLVVTVDREGKTRVKERYAVAAPLAGRLRRISLHAGDEVHEGQTVLAEIEPVDPALLDARSLAEAQARVGAAVEAIHRADENLQHAIEELRRAEALRPSDVASQEDLEHAQHRERIARYEQKIAHYERDIAQAALLRVQPSAAEESTSAALVIKSPISGVVLNVAQESSRVIPTGAEILSLGDMAELECVVDLLSRDAVRVRPGAKAFLDHWGGQRPLTGRVRRIEPGGFTKISALGVEEQRVNVLIDFDEPPQERSLLGDGYRVEARIVLSEADEVLQVPAGAVFRDRGKWAVYRVMDDKARLTAVEVGQHNGREAEILSGLAAGDVVVLYPSDRVRDSVAVAERTSR